jgi:hypothetical protein
MLGGVVGLFSLDARAWMYGPLHQSARYSGFGGAVQGLVEGAYATLAGTLFFARVAAAVVARATGSALFLSRAGPPDIFVLLSTLVWAYLIHASW